MMIMFESRRLGIKADESSASVAPPEKQDYLNLLLVFGPLLLIVVLLVGGMSASGSSIAAIALLLPLSFINPAVRRSPSKLLMALRNGGETFAQLLTAIAAVSIVISTLSATGRAGEVRRAHGERTGPFVVGGVAGGRRGLHLAGHGHADAACLCDRGGHRAAFDEGVWVWSR